MWPFNFTCKHPFDGLRAEKEQTVYAIDDDFEAVDYHFICSSCGSRLTHKHARTIGGVAAFLERGRQKFASNNTSTS